MQAARRCLQKRREILLARLSACLLHRCLERRHRSLKQGSRLLQPPSVNELPHFRDKGQVLVRL